MESKDIGPCTVCMIGSSLNMILDVTTQEIGLLHELDSSFFNRQYLSSLSVMHILLCRNI